MSTLQIVSIVFGIVGTLCSVIFGYIAFSQKSKETEKAEGKQDGVLFAELGYIKSGVDDIKRKQEKQDDQHVEVVSRLTAVEQSSKQAHKRLDHIEEVINQ